MIKDIELRNWKTHSDTKLSFQKGVNVLIGIMGSGKSSVMDAISFSLFGTFPALKQRRMKLEGVIKNRPSSEQEAEVKLTFVVGSDSYTVIRKITSSGIAVARLDKNGAHLQSQPIRVNEEIASILKVDYDTFARAVYAEQNGLDYFLSIAKGDRKKQIDGMLGLDQFAAAEENCTSLINSIKSVASGEEAILGSMNTASLKRQLDAAVAEKDKTMKDLAVLKEKEKSGKAELKKTEDEIDEQKKLFMKKDELSRRVVELNGKIEVLQEEIGKIDSRIKGLDQGAFKRELDDHLAKEKEEKRLIEEMEKGAKALTKAASDLQAEINNNEKRLMEKKSIMEKMHGKDLAELEKRVLDETAALNEMMNSKALSSSRLSDLEASIKELQRHLAKCPVCERDLGPELSEKLIASKRALADAIGKEAEKNDRLVDQKRATIKEISDSVAALSLASSRVRDYEGVEDAIKDIGMKLKSANKEAESANSALEKRRGGLDALREKINDAKASAELFKKRAEHDTEIIKYARLAMECKKDSDRITISRDDIDKTQRLFAEKGASLANISATIAGDERQVANLDASIIELIKQIDNIKELEQRLEKRRSVVKNLNGFRAALVETGAFLRTRLTQSINSLMQSIWPELYPYADYTRLRLNAKPDDYLLEASLESNGPDEWVQVDAVASGGERSIACLTMRIALSMVIVPNLRWLILDEPTHNIDSAGITKLINVLGDTLPKVVDQIFIITHDDSLKQITSAKIYQLDRDKGARGSTVVSEL
jgi:exonuclease SbcC